MSTDEADCRLVREILLWALENGDYNVGSSGENLHNDSHFTKEIGIRSLDLLDFFLRLEGHFGIQIHDHDYYSLTSVQAVLEFLGGQKEALEFE